MPLLHPRPWATGTRTEDSNIIASIIRGSLNNRLLARGYYEHVVDIATEWTGNPQMQSTDVHDHGLLGPVRLLRVVAPG